MDNHDQEAAPAAAASAFDNAALPDEIKRLNRSILTMRSMINELITSHDELKKEVASLKRPLESIGQLPAPPTKKRQKNQPTENQTPKRTCNNKRAKNASELHEIVSPHTTASKTNDEEIDSIISTLKQSTHWPIRTKVCQSFSNDPNLLKIRYHHSEKYQHIPIKLPSTGRKEDRMRCKLCVAKKGGRNTSYMCSVCEIALCTTCLMGEEEDLTKTHFARWHSVRDLVGENERCCEEMLRSRREGKKSTPS